MFVAFVFYVAVRGCITCIGGWVLAKRFIVEGSDDHGDDHGAGGDKWVSFVELLFARQPDLEKVQPRQRDGQ